jgi:hypothetical protein
MRIKNIRIENDEMIAFYEFSNGSPCTQRFPFPTEMSVITKWGEDKKAWFDQRNIDMAKTEEELIIIREKAIMEDLIRLRVEQDFMLNNIPIEEKVAIISQEIIKRK